MGLGLASAVFWPSIASQPARPAAVARGARTVSFPLALRTSADLAKAIGLDEEMAFRAVLGTSRSIARAKSAVLIEFRLPRAAWSSVAIRNPVSGLALKLGLDVLGRGLLGWTWTS